MKQFSHKSIPHTIKQSIVILFIMLFSHLASATPIILTDSTNEYNLSGHVSLYEDSTNMLGITDVMALDKKFVPTPHQNINLGFTHSTHWIKFEIHNSTDEAINLIYCVNYPFINEIKLYQKIGDSISSPMYSGLNFQSSVQHRNHIFPLSSAPNQSTIVYISFFNSGNTIDLPMQLINYNQFIENDNNENILYGMFFGVIIFIIIFNLFYFFILKEKVNNYYTLYVLSASFYVLNLSGITIQLFHNHKNLIFQLTAISVALLNFCLLNFSSKFLNLAQLSKFANTTMKLLKYISLILLCSYIIPIIFGVKIIFFASASATSLTLTTFIFLLYIAIISVLQKVPHSKYFMVAYIFGFVGLTSFLGKQSSLITDTIVTRNLLQITFLCETIIFFGAFLHRLRSQKTEQQKVLVDKNRKIERQKRLLEEANFELEQLSIIAQETTNGIVVFKADGEKKWTNKSFNKTYDTTPEESNCIENIYGELDFQTVYQECSSKKSSYRFNTKRNLSNQTFYIQTNLTPTYSENGKIESFIAIESNITPLIHIQDELKIAKEKAEQANKLKTAIMANVSHELRTPLNAIIGFSDLVLSKSFPEERLHKFIGLINVNGKKLLTQIESFLDIIKIESGSLSVFKSEFDINSLLKELQNTYTIIKNDQEKEHILINIQFAPEQENIINSDKEVIKQIFSHLLSNSIKFTHEGSITFGVDKSSSNNFISFFIKDTGIGLTEDKVNIATESFRQVDDSATREFGGTGLGLSIIKGLVNLLQGELIIEGEKGKGTLIQFTLKKDSF